jgi:integrase
MQISEKIVAELAVPAKGNKVHFFSGATLQGKKAPSGFGVRVTAGGTKSFVLFHRFDGRKYLETLGRWDENPKGGSLTVRDAIRKAADVVKDLQKGRREDPRPQRTRRLQDSMAGGLTVADLLDRFVTRYVEKEAGLRSADQIKDAFERLVKPRIGKLGIYEVRRSHIVEMLDDIADKNGPVMADRTLAHVRKAFNWHATRDDEFSPPIIKGMARTKSKDRMRQRVLDDEEIRDLWAALQIIEDVPPCYHRFVKTLLLTATRRSEAAHMHESELNDKGDEWKIPGARYKNKLDHLVQLSASARKLIGHPKRGSGYVFSNTNGDRPFRSLSGAKRRLDKTIAAIRHRDGRDQMPNWTLHDLRRTARSLMSRAKIPSDHAERALGHVIGGVRGVYDVYSYADEKRTAFEALGAIVERILDPQPNVTEMRRA